MRTNTFESDYYESETFWSGNMVQDPANMQRIDKTAMLIPSDVGNLVDVGCGNGVFLKYVEAKRNEIKLMGVERSDTALNYVTSEKLKSSIESIPLVNQSFDCVTCLEVLEHLPVDIYEKSLDELSRISKKYIIVSVPYKENLEESYTKCPQCKSMFNYELHVRSFDDNNVAELFNSRGFDCLSTTTAGTAVQLKGHLKFLKFFYPESFHVWRSPVCPFCGYSERVQHDANSLQVHGRKHSRRKAISYFTFLPKLIWPKETKDYWIIALFQRRSKLVI